MSALRKNNTGFDAKQLFVGTSGVFGVVTRAVLRVVPRPAQRTTALVGLETGAAALTLLSHLERALGDVLTAFEVLSAASLAPVFSYQPRLRNPFGAALPPYTALVELSTTLAASAVALEDLLETTLGDLLEAEGAGITDIFPGKPAELWDIRHHVSESHRHLGQVLGFDISVPRSAMADFVDAARALVAAPYPYVQVRDFGHWGDGGVHLNLVWQEEDAAPRTAAELKGELQPLVYDLAVRRFRGSFSAEHGVGPHNQPFYDRYTPEVVRAVCRALKARLDPRGLLGTARLG
jgi:FAD/FMN-containing dehydrogenase